MDVGGEILKISYNFVYRIVERLFVSGELKEDERRVGYVDEKVGIRYGDYKVVRGGLSFFVFVDD